MKAIGLTDPNGHLVKSPRTDGIRVLHIITATRVGGAERMLQKLLTTSDKALFASRVVSLTSKGPVGEELEKAAIEIRHLNAAGYLGMVAEFPTLVAELRAFRPHIIQSWMYHGNLAASIAAPLSRSIAPVIWNVRHSLEDLRGEKRLTAMMVRVSALLSRYALRVIYNSATSARQHCAIGYSRRNVVVIPNGFDTSYFRPSDVVRTATRKRFGLSEKDLLVGFIARYHPIKAHDDFLQAAAICSKELMGVRFLLAGEGITHSNKELSKLVADSGLDENILLLGERNDVHRLLPALDVLVLSSLSEGFPNVLGEAMACGVPCVATDVGDCALIISDTGILVPPAKPDLLGHALIELLRESSESLRRRGIKARERIERLFSIQAVVKQYENLYLSVLGKSFRYYSFTRSK